jgi:hypothetical protein
MGVELQSISFLLHVSLTDHSSTLSLLLYRGLTNSYCCVFSFSRAHLRSIITYPFFHPWRICGFVDSYIPSPSHTTSLSNPLSTYYTLYLRCPHFSPYPPSHSNLTLRIFMSLSGSQVGRLADSFTSPSHLHNPPCFSHYSSFLIHLLLHLAIYPNFHTFTLNQ